MSQAAVSVRRARVTDASMLAELGARLFLETYEHETPAADMASFLEQMHGLEQQTRELSSTDIATFIAEAAGTAIGYTQVRIKSVPDGTSVGARVELWRLYVDRRWHGLGVADQLLAQALDAVRAFGETMVWLSVWEQNPRAIAYYRKRGFELAGSHDFRVAASSYRDFVMVRRLPAGWPASSADRSTLAMSPDHSGR